MGHAVPPRTTRSCQPHHLRTSLSHSLCNPCAGRSSAGRRCIPSRWRRHRRSTCPRRSQGRQCALRSSACRLCTHGRPAGQMRRSDRPRSRYRLSAGRWGACPPRIRCSCRRHRRSTCQRRSQGREPCARGSSAAPHRTKSKCRRHRRSTCHRCSWHTPCVQCSSAALHCRRSSCWPRSRSAAHFGSPYSWWASSRRPGRPRRTAPRRSSCNF